MTQEKPLPSPAPYVRNCTFKFECDQLWENLQETDDDLVKQCQKCNERVYLVKDAWDLTLALDKNRCVAIPRVLIIQSKTVKKTHNLGQLSLRRENIE
jgi:hypothetical protein